MITPLAINSTLEATQPNTISDHVLRVIIMASDTHIIYLIRPRIPIRSVDLIPAATNILQNHNLVITFFSIDLRVTLSGPGAWYCCPENAPYSCLHQKLAEGMAQVFFLTHDNVYPLYKMFQGALAVLVSSRGDVKARLCILYLSNLPPSLSIVLYIQSSA